MRKKQEINGCVLTEMCLFFKLTSGGLYTSWFLLSTRHNWSHLEEVASTKNFLSYLPVDIFVRYYFWFLIDERRPRLLSPVHFQTGTSGLYNNANWAWIKGSKSVSSIPLWFLLQVTALSSYPYFPHPCI